MKKKVLPTKAVSFILVLLLLGLKSYSQELIAYWNFNTGANGTPWNAPIPASTGDGTITAGTWTWGNLDFTDGFGGSTQNALFGDPAGASLSLRSNEMNGNYIQFEFSMSGFENLVLSYWTQKTATGFNNNQWAWSTDGVNFTNFGEIISPSLSPGTVVTLELSNLNSVPMAYLRYILDGATGATGNNRIDNVQIRATQIGGVLPPANLTALAVSTTQINLNWDKNSNQDNVLIAWSNTETFGTPTGSYSTGDPIIGGGTVLYYGSDVTFNHTGLTPYTRYYYKAWSRSGDNYSTGITSNAITHREPVYTTLPYSEPFDNDLGDCYPYTVSGIKPWYFFSNSAAANGHNGQSPEEQWLILPGINFDNYSNEVMNFKTFAQYGINNESNYLKLFYSTDYPGNGNPVNSSWTQLNFQQPEGINNTTEVSAFSGNIDLSGISGNQVFIAFKYYSTTDPTRWRVDDINIYESDSPMINVDPTSLYGFTYEIGEGPSNELSFTVSGANLTDNITITPPEHYEISTVSGTGFTPANPVVLQQINGIVEGIPVYVRLMADLPIGSYDNEVIVISSPDATSVNVVCNGTVTPHIELPLVINDLDFVYNQDFNTLASSGTGNPWTDNQTIKGWYWQSPGDRDPNVVGYTTNDGTSNSAFATSFGTVENSDRAMGAISGSSNRNYYQGVQFKNNTGSPINLSTIYISYTGEQWRQNANAHALDFSYAISPTIITDIKTGNWTENSNLTFVAPQTGTEGALNGNLPENRTEFVNIPLANTGVLGAGEFLMLRWAKTQSFSPGLAIDDFMLSLSEITVIANPSNFNASTVSMSEINLSWELNSNSNPVILAWSNDGIFGSEPDTQIPGQTITGGGTVMYFGTNTSADHEDLEAGTTYYYKIWSYNGSSYSTGVTAQATTYALPAMTELPYNETFDNDLGDCYVYSVSGDTKTWNYNSGNKTAQINGHNSGETEEDWLILPGINFNNYQNEVMTFDLWWNYGSDDDDNYLKLFYSSDYPGVGDPSSANWTSLDFEKPAESSSWESSGEIDLSTVSGSIVYIGFKYRYEAGNYRWWQIDNISITGEANGTGDIVKKQRILNISPNPSSGVAILNLPDKPCVVKVFDTKGDLMVQTETTEQKITLNLELLKKGLYLIDVVSMDGEFHETIKLILN
ncbi:MAG: choice-of-anchor J domain-containing protein [Bacteroidales bacterium]